VFELGRFSDGFSDYSIVGFSSCSESGIVNNDCGICAS
jgi:hypothetical protein